MKPLPKISVRPADWHVDRSILRAIREEVFVREQFVPVGTGRLLPDGHIGRMAVLKPWRGHGAGGALLTSLMNVARELGMRRVVLNAQIQAMPFYIRHGFQAEGEKFMDAGIPHRRMWRDL